VDEINCGRAADRLQLDPHGCLGIAVESGADDQVLTACLVMLACDLGESAAADEREVLDRIGRLEPTAVRKENCNSKYAF